MKCRNLFILSGFFVTFILSCSAPTRIAETPRAMDSKVEAVQSMEKCKISPVELPIEKWLTRPSGFAVDDEARFFTNNSKVANVVTLQSGVQYKVLRSGCGDKPLRTNTVKVRYHLTLLDGKTVDSSYNDKESPSFILGSVIPGWIEAVELMQRGAIWEIYIPSRLAYGTQGGGPVPKNAPLFFTVELIDFY